MTPKPLHPSVVGQFDATPIRRKLLTRPRVEGNSIRATVRMTGVATDMRATERLLEVLHLQLTEVFTATPDEAITDRIGDALDIVCKLRRRGDTLVRADDLRLAVSGSRWTAHQNSSQTKAAIDRLENALGGKML